MNVHNAGSHLVDYVEAWGPLWAWSTFGFEDMNGTLMDYCHGTGNVCRQVLNRHFVFKRHGFSTHILNLLDINDFSFSK